MHNEDKHTDVAVGIFNKHTEAEQALRNLNTAGFEMNSLSIIGQGYHPDEKVVGFYNIGERVTFWGARGAFWGGLWGLFFTGVFVSLPIAAPIIALGYVAVMVTSAIETAIIAGGVSALIAALYSLGIPKDSVIIYEKALESDKFIVMAHGTEDDINMAKEVLAKSNSEEITQHKISTDKIESAKMANEHTSHTHDKNHHVKANEKMEA